MSHHDTYVKSCHVACHVTTNIVLCNIKWQSMHWHIGFSLYLLRIKDTIRHKYTISCTHWTAATWRCTPLGQWSPWVVAAVGLWSFVAGAWALRRQSGWSGHSQPGPLQLQLWQQLQGPLGPGQPREHAPRAGQRRRGEGEEPAGLGAAAGEEDWWKNLKASLRKGGGSGIGGREEWGQRDGGTKYIFESQ